MNCKTYEELVQNETIDETTAKALQQHYESCEICRKRRDPPPQHGVPDPAAVEVVTVSEDITETMSDDLFDKPSEFKDASITFTLVVDDREEEIKIVEPELDYPIPEDARLQIKEKNDCITDVIFKFDANAQQPYALIFNCRNGEQYKGSHIQTFGVAKSLDKELTQLHKEKILDRGGVEAFIEMTRGKARVHIKYRNH